jgi:endonuclease III-like uncharacterized protein
MWQVFRFHNLVALMLSAQTKDQITHAAMGRLKQNGLSVDMILNTPEEKIQELIYPVGFYKVSHHQRILFLLRYEVRRLMALWSMWCVGICFRGSPSTSSKWLKY